MARDDCSEGRADVRTEAAGREGERDGFHWTPETAWAWNCRTKEWDQINWPTESDNDEVDVQKTQAFLTTFHSLIPVLSRPEAALTLVHKAPLYFLKTNFLSLLK